MKPGGGATILLLEDERATAALVVQLLAAGRGRLSDQALRHRPASGRGPVRRDAVGCGGRWRRRRRGARHLDGRLAARARRQPRGRIGPDRRHARHLPARRRRNACRCARGDRRGQPGGCRARGAPPCAGAPARSAQAASAQPARNSTITRVRDTQPKRTRWTAGSTSCSIRPGRRSPRSSSLSSARRRFPPTVRRQADRHRA